jgi:hypothetical protein
MKKVFTFFVLTALTAACSLQAKENLGTSGKTAVGLKRSAAGCQPATAQTDLNINNVRTTLLAGGDIWWNLNDARYEIPKIDPPGSAPSVHSLFAGAVWLGGIDAGGQLKIAAQTYRQTGNDFWPGPLDNTGNVSEQTCQDYDRHWKVLGSEVDALIAAFEAGGRQPLPDSDVPESLREWPARGNANAKGARGVSLDVSSMDLAPFYDQDGDGLYNPNYGDYPVIRKKCEDVYADEMIFWVYNDKGNIHSETGGQAIGVQVNSVAFAFSTSDEVNNMTFYSYEIKNSSTVEIDQFYMGQWVDPDLGCFLDDYVGVDTSRSLGIVYNGRTTDPDCATRGYGADPPALGVDFFEGPLDENGVEIGLSYFTFYYNDFTPRGNPVSAVQFYNYMKGIWKDGLPFTYGGNGVGGTTPTNYMYPDDPTNSAGWSMCSQNFPTGNTDFRFVQSSGPFTLKPGAVNNITVGVVWNRNPSCACGSGGTFEQCIGQVDDKAQALFDNCFKLVDGPDAPTIAIRELDRELILSFINEPGSNNINEGYDQIDPIANSLAQTDPTITDVTYTFQGYLLYQLKNAQVTANELSDISKARLVAQVDIKDGVSKIINYKFDPNLGSNVATLMVDGANTGLKKTFQVLDDKFATDNPLLVNHETYYYAALAYAYNNYKTFNPQDPTAGGQMQPYLQGRRRFKVYSAIPHKTMQQSGGTGLFTTYGQGVPVTRIEGKGNGGLNLELTEESVNQILTAPGGLYGPVTYAARRGPIDVKIVDPMAVKDVNFELTFVDTSGDINSEWKLQDSTSWFLTANGSLIYEGNAISNDKEHLIEDYGISISFGQTINTGDVEERLLQNYGIGQLPNFGFMDASIEFEDAEKQWLTGVQDQGQFGPLNWVRSGRFRDNPTAGSSEIFDDHNIDSLAFYDPNENFEQIIGGIFAPYCLAGNYQRKGLSAPYDGYPYSEGPAFPTRFRNNFTTYRIPDYTLDSVFSVDLVITPDKTKWTRCVVIETSEDPAQAEGNAYKGQIRQGNSLDENGNLIPGEVGRSWFPGYAINVETGERLNIMFGESSWLVGERGRDMIWNPTSTVTTPLFQYFMGGKHFVYIMNTRYDGGEYNRQVMTDYFNKFQCVPPPPSGIVDADQCIGAAKTKQSPLEDSIYNKIMWVGAFTLAEGFEFKSYDEGLVPSEVKMKIRVQRAYARFFTDGSNNGLNKYAFSTDGLAPDTSVKELAQGALHNIKVVPNPYYAYSGYEISQLDNKVKITNLPSSCVVSIYTLDGQLIRQYNRAVASNTSPGAPTDRVNLDSSLDWDLKNTKGIPIASGVYIIHIKADGLGEKVVKWFGAMRPTDLDTF